jgi:cytochrome c oxidase subunit III
MTERNKLAMLLFVTSEATFFLLLICAYVFYHRTGARGPNAANSLNVVKSAIFSVALLSSSLTMWRAGLSLGRQRRRQGSLWLLVTIVLGVVFLGGQGSE